MATSTGQAILAVLESDLLTAEGTPILAFLTSFGQAAGDPLKIAAAWVALQGAFIGGMPGLESALSQQIAAALNAKLVAAIAAAQAKLVAVTPK
jgi:hypothetical protein